LRRTGWPAAYIGKRARVYPRLDHYTIMSELARPGSDIHRDVRAVIDGTA
jgi:hypothetical protein